MSGGDFAGGNDADFAGDQRAAAYESFLESHTLGNPPPDALRTPEALASSLPSSWVAYLWRNERRLFILSGLCKVLWSSCLMGIMYYLHYMGDVATGSNGYTKDTPKSLWLCFGIIPMMLLYSVANLGKDYFSSEMASRTKARLAALIAEQCVLYAASDASERSVALSLASNDTNQVAPPPLPPLLPRDHLALVLPYDPHAPGVRWRS
jgi:hypothetical protein